MALSCDAPIGNGAHAGSTGGAGTGEKTTNPFHADFSLDAFSTSTQYIVITSVLFFFTLLYGYLQELVCIHLFARQYGLFLTLVQFLGYTFFATLQRLHKGDRRRHTIPLSYCAGLAVSQASMQGLSNVAMRYINYPAKVLFKSCRVLPTMLVGVVVYRKRYSVREWLAVLLLVAGLVSFMQADMNASPEMNPIGIVLITLSLAVDSGIINVQDHCFTHFHSDEDEVVFASYAGGSVVVLAACLATGELASAVAFMDATFAGSQGYLALSLGAFATCGYCGVACVAALTRRFGALVAALTTTARKALTLCLSFLLFPKPLTPSHLVGASIFILGIALKASAPRSRRAAPRTPGAPSASSSPASLAKEGSGGAIGTHKAGDGGMTGGCGVSSVSSDMRGGPDNPASSSLRRLQPSSSSSSSALPTSPSSLAVSAAAHGGSGGSGGCASASGLSSGSGSAACRGAAGSGSGDDGGDWGKAAAEHRRLPDDAV